MYAAFLGTGIFYFLFFFILFNCQLRRNYDERWDEKEKKNNWTFFSRRGCILEKKKRREIEKIIKREKERGMPQKRWNELDKDFKFLLLFGWLYNDVYTSEREKACVCFFECFFEVIHIREK